MCKRLISILSIFFIGMIISACNSKSHINKEANGYTLIEKENSAPIYDAKTDKIVAQAYKNFHISLDKVKDNRAYFSLSIHENPNGNPTNKEFYIPIKYLKKTYKDPFLILEIISTDMLSLKENAEIYDDNDNPIAKFTENIGAMRFIQKTDKGYQLVIANNLVYIKEEDIIIIPQKQ